MDLQDFNDLLKSADNKLSVFTDFTVLQNISFDINELVELIKTNLSSIEILNLLNHEYYQQLSDSAKNELITFMEFPMDSAVLAIFELNNELKKMLLTNKTFILKNFNANAIPLLCGSMDEETKEKILQLYSDEKDVKIGIYKDYTDEKKVEILTLEQGLTLEEKLEILFSIKDENIGIFLQQNPNFCDENEITEADFMTQLMECKRTIVSNRSEIERSIDITDFPLEYRECIDFTSQLNRNFIVIDLNSDLDEYRGLDKFIRIYPQEFNEDKIKKLMKLCEICPNLQVCNRLGNDDKTENYLISSGQEYLDAEKWITSVMRKLKPEYTSAQKIAIIDNEIGKKISYSPEFSTKNFDSNAIKNGANAARCLWKIISSGYGVCNGIANVEQYIFNRVGIESEFIVSSEHAFLKVENVDIELSNGQFAKINGILDPTWNLASHTFGGQPDNFIISYEEARKHDIDSRGKDCGAHFCDKKLKNLNNTLDDNDLKYLFQSVGITNPDGTFPLELFLNKLKGIDEQYTRKSQKNHITKIKYGIISIYRSVIIKNGNFKINERYSFKYTLPKK